LLQHSRGPLRHKKKAWEVEYPKKGGFIGPADFVSKATTGAPFDDFVTKNAVANKIIAGFPGVASPSAKQYFQSELFHLRNRIAHWGYVNTSQSEAERCHALAIAIVSVLREMDKIKYGSQ